MLACNHDARVSATAIAPLIQYQQTALIGISDGGSGKADLILHYEVTDELWIADMTFKQVPTLPRGLSSKPTIAPSTTASWFPAESVEKQVLAGSGFTYRPGKIWFGRTATDQAEPIGWGSVADRGGILR